MKIITIPNLYEFQHYKDRNPSWIKLYCRILKSYNFLQLTPAERYVYMALLIVGTEKKNQIPADFAYISREISTTQRLVNDAMIKMMKMNMTASKRVPKLYGIASIDKIREDKIRKDKNGDNKFKSFKASKEDLGVHYKP